VVKKFKLKIPVNLINEPIIYKMVTQYDVVPNILVAHLDKESEGEVVIEIKGTPENVEKGMDYLRQLRIEITEL